MPAPASRAQHIAACLSAVECEPRLARHPDHIRIEADVPEGMSASRWRFVLAALADADRFGDGSNAGRHTIWAVIATAEHAGTTGPTPVPGEPEGAEVSSSSPPRQRGTALDRKEMTT